MADIDWHVRADAVVADGRSLIDGRRGDTQSGETFEKLSPINGKPLVRVARGQAADIDRAVVAARRAFESARWSGQAPAARKKVVHSETVGSIVKKSKPRQGRQKINRRKFLSPLRGFVA